jgi:hypothetical protein
LLGAVERFDVGFSVGRAWTLPAYYRSGTCGPSPYNSHTIQLTRHLRRRALDAKHRASSTESKPARTRHDRAFLLLYARLHHRRKIGIQGPRKETSRRSCFGPYETLGVNICGRLFSQSLHDPTTAARHPSACSQTPSVPQRQSARTRAPDVDPADSGASVLRSCRVSVRGLCCAGSRKSLEPVDFLL